VIWQAGLSPNMGIKCKILAGSCSAKRNQWCRKAVICHRHESSDVKQTLRRGFSGKYAVGAQRVNRVLTEAMSVGWTKTQQN